MGRVVPPDEAVRRLGHRAPLVAPVSGHGPPAGPSDEALMAGMAIGDDLAALAFVRRYQKRVFGLAVGLLGDAGVAEDVAQEALLRAWRHAPVFDARRGTVTSWVLTITRNLAIDAIRRRRASPTDPDDLVAMGLAGGGLPVDEEVMAGQLSPGLRAAVNALPAEQRRATLLSALYGRTAEEISVSESIPLGTAKTRIRAGLQKLRAALDDAKGPS